jgi:hypothetical protein
VDWKDVKLAWAKYEVQGSPSSFPWQQADLPEFRNSSTVQQDKTVQKTSSNVEESKSGEPPPVTQNSTVAQECGEETVVERRDAACVVNPSFATSQKVVKKLHLKELEVCLKLLSPSVIEKHIRQSDFPEMDVSFERLNDDAVPLVEQSAAVPVRNISSEVLPTNTDGPSSCNTSKLTHAPVNTALCAGEGNSLVSVTDLIVLGSKVDSYPDCQEMTSY